MPAGIKPPQCVGKKGKSGRKTVGEEIINKAKEEIYKDVFNELLPNRLLAEKHLELITVPKKIRTTIKGDLVNETEELDGQSIAKGLDMAYKIKGEYAPIKGDPDLPTEKLATLLVKFLDDKDNNNQHTDRVQETV